MAEVMKTTQTGQTSQLFVQFVTMQQRQTQLALGTIAGLPPGSPPANLRLARVFIDQLAMIRIKTAGNLDATEAALLDSVLKGLQESYLEVSQSAERSE
jgi:hypothetical protein